MKPTLPALTIAVALCVAISGCADMKATPSGPVADTRIANPDTFLADAVRWELNMRPALGASGLKVVAKDGEVTLTGNVATGQQLAQIAMTVQKLPGVRAVLPDINVGR